MSLTEEKIIEIVRGVVATSDRPIGMVEYGILVARAIEAELAKQKAEPVAWCLAYDDPRMGRIHSTPSMYEPEIDAHVSRCEGRVVKASLYPAPVVPDVMVDCIGLALDLEARAKTVESQTTERAMLAAANGLRLIAAAQEVKE